MDQSDVHNSSAQSLSYMMDPDADSGQHWEAEELGEILEHQLAARLECDLADKSKQVSEELEAAEKSGVKTFGDLLQHANPPLELLKLTRRFAKGCRTQPDAPLPDEVATVLYFLSIAAALVRCGSRITKMDDKSLRYSLDWALKQPWLDEASRGLLREGQETIDALGAARLAGDANHADDPGKQTTPPRIAGLIERIKESADKLASDRTSRGDLKILSRTLKELRYAFKVFTPYRNSRKVTVFGSARTAADHPAYTQAVDFGRAMAERGWLVITGAAQGIMEAGHVGAGRENAMGLNILLPFEQEANPIIAGDHKLVHMKYFFTRKLMFVKESHAICLLPGGFGTLDEGLEVLTLLQTGKRDAVPVVFLDEPGGNYWAAFQEFVEGHLLANRCIDQDDLSLYKMTDSVDEAVDEIIRFFRIYHSMRYAHGKLVLRLSERPNEALLRRINAEFGDMLSEGRFTVSDALPEEKDEPELAEMPRLVFHFNRRNSGRLRQLIDYLNQEM